MLILYLGHDVNIIKIDEEDPWTVLPSQPIQMDWLPVPVSDLISEHMMEGTRGITSEADLWPPHTYELKHT